MNVFSIIGWILILITKPAQLDSPWIFYVGRFLSGFGLGSSALSSTIYINEIVEVSIRGALGNLMQFMLTVGVLFDNGIGALIPWEVLTGLCLIFPGAESQLW